MSSTRTEIELTNGLATIARYVVDHETYDAWWEQPMNIDPFGDDEWFRVENTDLMAKLDELGERSREFMGKLDEVRI